MRAINLFPWREKKRRKQNRRVVFWILGLAIAFLLANLLIVIIYQNKIGEFNLKLSQLNCQLTGTKEKIIPARQE